MNRVGILTSGGDAPGMNAALRAAVRMGHELGLETIGIRHGYKGLIDGDFQNFGIQDVSGIIEHGGTVLQSKRAPEFRQPEFRAEALRNINQKEIDGLIVMGGDGSLRGAAKLQEEGVPTIGLPATIDNDIFGTDISIGVDTALNMVVEALDRIRDTATALERAFLVEVMGRESGYIALMGGLAGGAEVILIPEIDYDFSQIAEQVYQGYKRGKQHFIIVVAEGVHRQGPAAHYVADQLKEQVGFETRVTVLGHMQRGGSPSAFDRTLAARLGAKGIRALSDEKTGMMMGLRGSQVKAIDFEEVLGQRKKVDMDLYKLAQIISK